MAILCIAAATASDDDDAHVKFLVNDFVAVKRAEQMLLTTSNSD